MWVDDFLPFILLGSIFRSRLRREQQSLVSGVENFKVEQQSLVTGVEKFIPEREDSIVTPLFLWSRRGSRDAIPC